MVVNRYFLRLNFAPFYLQKIISFVRLILSMLKFVKEEDLK